MNYYSLVICNLFQVHSIVPADLRCEVPFEGGMVSEIKSANCVVDIEGDGCRRWEDTIQSDCGNKCLYLSDQGRNVVEKHRFTGIDFNQIDVRKYSVPRVLQKITAPRYWSCRINGHVRATEIRDEWHKQSPYTLDSTGLKFVISHPKGGDMHEYVFSGRPLVSEKSPDFVEPAPMRGWTVLVSERVAEAFEAAKLTGYKLNPLLPGGRCRL